MASATKTNKDRTSKFYQNVMGRVIKLFHLFRLTLYVCYCMSKLLWLHMVSIYISMHVLKHTGESHELVNMISFTLMFNSNLLSVTHSLPFSCAKCDSRQSILNTMYYTGIDLGIHSSELIDQEMPFSCMEYDSDQSILNTLKYNGIDMRINSIIFTLRPNSILLSVTHSLPFSCAKCDSHQSLLNTMYYTGINLGIHSSELIAQEMPFSCMECDSDHSILNTVSYNGINMGIHSVMLSSTKWS